MYSAYKVVASRGWVAEVVIQARRKGRVSRAGLGKISSVGLYGGGFGLYIRESCYLGIRMFIIPQAHIMPTLSIQGDSRSSTRGVEDVSRQRRARARLANQINYKALRPTFGYLPHYCTTNLYEQHREQAQEQAQEQTQELYSPTMGRRAKTAAEKAEANRERQRRFREKGSTSRVRADSEDEAVRTPTPNPDAG